MKTVIREVQTHLLDTFFELERQKTDFEGCARQEREHLEMSR